MRSVEQVPLRQVPVISLTSIAPDVYVLRIPHDADFLPGQVVGITTTPSIPPRLFSLCSGTKDPYWEILFNIKHDGILSPRLAQVQPNDNIQVSLPFGSFIDDDTPSWWIATGTGIAPFRAMLRSGQATRKTLIHGARRAHGFYFAEEFAARMDKQYTRCCSQESPSGAYTGRLTDWLRAHQELPPDAPYLLCGSAEMVVEVRDILITKHIPIENIHAEIYF